MNEILPGIGNRMSQLLQAIAPTARLELLLAIGESEACVCHLEALTGYRQAYISQHLMALRDAGVIAARREGRYMYYRLQDRALLALLASAGELCGISPAELARASLPGKVASCACPHCTVDHEASRLQIELPQSIT